MTTSDRPLVICTSLNAEEGPHYEILESAGFEVRCVDRSLNLFDSQQMMTGMEGAVASVAGSEPYTPEVLKALPNLRVIARTGVGFDAIDLTKCDEQQIVVTTTPGVNHHAVAEHTIAMLMAIARGFPEQDRRVREDRWERVATPRVMGCTLGLVGLGRIGQAVATRAVGLGMKVIALEPFPQEDFVQKWDIELVSLNELLKRSDYVSLHCPMSPENHHLMCDDTLAQMKPGSVLINTARGLLIDELALMRALNSGHLRGAGLDVFETEPLSMESPLIECPQVLLSGHVAGLDHESHHDTFKMAAETIIGLRNGEWPAFCIQNLNGVENWSWDRK